MIKADFRRCENEIIGFTVKGHAGYAESGQDIICAGVSSAIMLTVNTITDFIGAEAEVDINHENIGYAFLELKAPYKKEATVMLESFLAHLTLLEEDYGHIMVRISDTTKSSN